MNKRACIILTVAALLVGFLSGGLGVASWYKPRVGRYMAIELEADAGATVVVLRRLRAGNTNNAIECLETDLDGDLLSMALIRTTTPDFMRDPSFIQTRAMVKAYRTEFPHKSSHPDIDEKVAKALQF